MNKTFTILICLLFIGCTFEENKGKGYEFSNFDNTPLDNLALAVRNENVSEIKNILNDSR